MIPLQSIAGFGPKDLMMVYYAPAIGVLALCSFIFLVIDLIKKRRTRPYVASYFIVYIFAYVWYAYDKVKKHDVDHAQAILLGGFSVVLAVLTIASTPIVPETRVAVNAAALAATALALIFLTVAIFAYCKKQSRSSVN